MKKKLMMKVKHEKNWIKAFFQNLFFFDFEEKKTGQKTRLPLVASVMFKTILPNRHKNLVVCRLIEPIFLKCRRKNVNLFIEINLETPPPTHTHSLSLSLT